MFKQTYQAFYHNIAPDSELIQKTKNQMHIQVNRSKRRIWPRLYWVGAAAACLAVSIIAAIAANGGLKINYTTDQNTDAPYTEINQPYEPEASVLIKEENTSPINQTKDLPSDMDKAMGEPPIQLSEAEAYQNQTYGRFLPRQLLSGFQFESAAIYHSGKANEALSFLYCSGYNDIRVLVRKYQQQDDPSRVGAEETKRYDITQYEIPFADSVPEELYPTMFHPIFPAEEINEDVISRRIVAVDDVGEGHHESVVFAFQYGEFLVEYNVKAKSMDGVYDMVRSADCFQ